MLSRSSTGLISLRDAAADIGLCLSDFRLLKIGYPQTSRGMCGLGSFEYVSDLMQ